MNLREIAESDLAYTLEDTGGAGTPYTLIDPVGNEYALIGTYKDIGYLQDEENSVPVQGRTVTVTYRQSSLLRQTARKPEQGWRVRIIGFGGVEHILSVIHYDPDRSLGIGRLTLEVQFD
jgi:hypothetical protein